MYELNPGAHCLTEIILNIDYPFVKDRTDFPITEISCICHLFR